MCVRSVINSEITDLIAKPVKEQSFYQPSLQLALDLLKLNNKNEAERFEPLTLGENKAAIAAIKKTDWKKFQYSAILVPGAGPEDLGHAISPFSKLRVQLAAERYKKGLAPFIIVSGGFVHPFQTPYCEAIEMKEELMAVYKIPASAIIIEPFARHTTTNIRDANRLIYRYGINTKKPILITTTIGQSTYIESDNFKNRCHIDFNYLPYENLTRISPFDLSYYPIVTSLHMDNSDPLDP